MRAAQNRWTKRLGRVGFTAKGILYGLVGLIAIGVAFGERGKVEDQSGALAALAARPFGKTLLIALAIGLGLYALWRLTFVFFGTPGDSGNEGNEGNEDKAERAGSIVLAIIYGSLCAYAVGIIAGAGSKGGASAGPDKATQTLLDQPLGVALVIAVGAALAVLAAFEAYKGISRSFLDKLKTSEMNARQLKLVTAVGVAGHIARAIVGGLVAAFVVKAAVEDQAGEAIGLDGALRKVVAEPAGPLLLGIVAAGLMLYGLYCVIEGRYRKL